MEILASCFHPPWALWDYVARATPLQCLHPGVGERGMAGMILARAGDSCIPLQVVMNPCIFFANLLLTAAVPSGTHACTNIHFE